jgi:hypothetical protein
MYSNYKSNILRYRHRFEVSFSSHKRIITLTFCSRDENKFVYHVLHKNANLVILSMSWYTNKKNASKSDSASPDLDTLSKLLIILEPVIRNETTDEIICVFANQVGTEGEFAYTGTSAVFGIYRGDVNVYGILGHGNEDLLIVDTKQPARRRIITVEGGPWFVDLHPSSKRRNTSRAVVNRGRSLPRNDGISIPESSGWLSKQTDSVRNQNVVYLTMREAKELNDETKEYLSIMFPAAAWFVLLASSHHQELLNLPKINAPDHMDIETIYVYTPKPSTLKLETDGPDGEHLLYKPHNTIIVYDQKDRPGSPKLLNSSFPAKPNPAGVTRLPRRRNEGEMKDAVTDE